jgi:hypothetical protein
MKDDGETQQTVVMSEPSQSIVMAYLKKKDWGEYAPNGKVAFDIQIDRIILGMGLLGSIRDRLNDEQEYPPECETIKKLNLAISNVRIPEATPTAQSDYTTIKISGRDGEWRILRGMEESMLAFLYNQLYDKPRLTLATIEAEIDNILYNHGILHPTENLETTGWVRFLEVGGDMDDDIMRMADEMVARGKFDRESVIEEINKTISQAIEAQVAEAVKKALEAAKNGQ